MSKRPLLLLAVLILVAGTAGGYHLWRAKRPSMATAPTAVAASASVTHDDRPRDTHARIHDTAAILDPFVPRLGRMADAIASDLGIDVHVVSTTDGATPIETQADQIFQKRGIGRDSHTGGLLILLDPKLSSARIEVGYALEGVMTDLHMSRLARDQLAPYVGYGSAGMAVMDVLHYLRDQAFLEAARGNLDLPEKSRALPEYLSYQKYLSGGAGARAALTNLPADADLKKAIPADERSQYAPAATPEGSVEAFLKASADLAGDPTLDLFTEGSRLMRANYPVAPFETLQRLESVQASRPLDYRIDGNYAVVSSKRPAKGFVPILLHREGNVWRVDLVETWKNLFFDPDGNYFLRNSNTPYAKGLQQFGKGGYYDIAALPLITGSIEGDVADRRFRSGTLSALRRGEIWLRNAFVFPRAWIAYQEALRAAPHDPLVLETIGSRAQYLGFPEIAIPALERIGRGVELTLASAYDEQGDRVGAARWVSRALEENPLELHALRWREYLAKESGDAKALALAQRELATVSADPQRAFDPVTLWFHPESPRFEPDKTIDVGGTTVYDHCHFGVTLRNTSGREVEIENVVLTSLGTASTSGLGDIKSYWTFPSGGNRLKAGEAVYFERDWGFVVDTGHEHVRYAFRVCWHGTGTRSPLRQCRTQWIDSLP